MSEWHNELFMHLPSVLKYVIQKITKALKKFSAVIESLENYKNKHILKTNIYHQESTHDTDMSHKRHGKSMILTTHGLSRKL